MRTLPPGPQQGRFTQTVAFHRNPLGVLRDAQERYGDVFTLRMLTPGPTVVIADPQLAREVPKFAVAGRARRRVLPQASPLSVFGADETHAAARVRAGAPLTREAVAAKRPAIERIAREHIDRWPHGRPFRLLPRMRALADEIFVREILGAPPEMARDIGSLLYTPGNPPISVPGPHQGLVGKLVNAEFERRRARIAQRLGKDTDELLAVIMAGQEPMAAALTRVTLCAAGEAVAYSREVALEALRLFPAALASLRELTEPLRTHGYEIPRGTTVMVPLPLIHRDPRVFEAPDEFRPGRPGDGALPFGDGLRRCLGEQLAWAELDAVVPLALGLGVRPVGPQPERMVLRGTILVPQRSGLVRA